MNTQAPQPCDRPEARISVCHIASGDLWAGAEAQISNLLKVLAQKPELTLHALLLNEGRLATELRGCGIDTKIIPEASNSFRNILSRAADYLSGRGVQILHSHRYKENLLATGLHLRCGIPYLVRTEHGWTEPTFGARKLKHAAVRTLDRVAAKRYANLIISPSEDLRKKIVGFADSRKIVTVWNAIDTSLTKTELTVAAAKRHLGIAETSPVVGCAGRLEPIKRLDRFLAAAVRIQAKVPEVRFVIAGEGSQRGELEKLARSLGILDSVLFCGHRDDILDVLQALDLFVMTSDHEGLPIALLQAMCLQKPAVCTGVGGIPEVIESGRSGLLVDAGDAEGLVAACISILCNQAKADSLGRAARNEIVSRFDVSSHAEQVVRLYRGLCQGR